MEIVELQDRINKFKGELRHLVEQFDKETGVPIKGVSLHTRDGLFSCVVEVDLGLDQETKL